MHLGLILKRTAVFLNDAGRDGQAETGAGVLGSEEGIEETFLDFGRNALARIRDFEDDDV